MEETKKAISPILKKMNIGDIESYPYRKFTSIKTTIDRIQRETLKKFSYRTLGSGKDSKIEVTRVS
jgi:hypothetical protein